LLTGIIVAVAWLVAGFIVTGALFQRRDA